MNLLYLSITTDSSTHVHMAEVHLYYLTSTWWPAFYFSPWHIKDSNRVLEPRFKKSQFWSYKQWLWTSFLVWRSLWTLLFLRYKMEMIMLNLTSLWMCSITSQIKSVPNPFKHLDAWYMSSSLLRFEVQQNTDAALSVLYPSVDCLARHIAVLEVPAWQMSPRW